MREIKFRAWDKCNERMIEPRNILKICMSRLNQEPYLIVYLRKWMNPDREIREADKRYTNEFNLMQYTGLKDKNGKEIYEGDIVKYFDNKEHIVVVENIKELGTGMYLKRVGSGYYTLNPSVIRDYEVEVIGDIYENPELLEVV